jgi:hypothetical protein
MEDEEFVVEKNSKNRTTNLVRKTWSDNLAI